MPDTDNHIKDSILNCYINLLENQHSRRGPKSIITSKDVSDILKEFNFILNVYHTFKDLNIEIINYTKFIAYVLWLSMDSIGNIAFLINKNKAITMAYINDIRDSLECHQKLLDKLTTKEADDNANI